MNYNFYHDLPGLIEDAFDEAFGRKPLTTKPKKIMNTQTELIVRLSSDATAILEALKSSTELMGKSAVLSYSSQIKPHKWNTAIKELKNNSLIYQEGFKKGAKYGVIEEPLSQ